MPRPFRGVSFQLTNQLGNGDGFAEPAEDMDMVLDATDFQRWAIQLAASTGQIRMQANPAVAIGKPGRLSFVE